MHFTTYITNFMLHQDTWDLANVAQCSAGGLILALSIPSVGIGSIFGGETREFHKQGLPVI